MIPIKEVKVEKVCLSETGKSHDCFFNTMTAGHKYSLLNRDNLRQPTQVQLFLKGKTFSEFFSTFLTGRLNFEHFQKKDDPHS